MTVKDVSQQGVKTTCQKKIIKASPFFKVWICQFSLIRETFVKKKSRFFQIFDQFLKVYLANKEFSSQNLYT